MSFCFGPLALLGEIDDVLVGRGRRFRVYLMECTCSALPSTPGLSLTDICYLPSSVRERLKEILRQYELRERHFECVVRSKELEVLLSRARAAEQKQLAEAEKARAEKLEEEVGVARLSASHRDFARGLTQCCARRTEQTAAERAGRRDGAANHPHQQAAFMLSRGAFLFPYADCPSYTYGINARGWMLTT